MAAVRLWGTVLTGMMSSGKSMSENAGSGADTVFSTEFSMHQVSYYFMVWSSLTFGGIMMIEQYFGRRMFCFSPSNFTQPPDAIGEYCWEHGHFEKTQANINFYVQDETWILESFVYFFIRATVFILPHLVWQLNYEAWVVAVIKGSVGLVKELQKLWLQFSEVADQAYREHNDTVVSENARLTKRPITINGGHNSRDMDYENILKPSPSTQQREMGPTNLTPAKSNMGDEVTNEQLQQEKLQKTFNAVMAMTRDVVQITKQQVPHYTGITYFIIGRLVYDALFMLLFALLDFAMFNISNRYDSTDYYCKLPNSETIRCMVPMMSFQWYASFFAMTSCFLMLLVNIVFTVRMFVFLFSNSTKDTFFDHIPYSSNAADTTWHLCVNRKTYKLLSKFLMQNICILHPLNFLESFVNHMKENHQVGEDLLSRIDRDGIQMTTFGAVAGSNDKTDGDDQLWRRLIQT